MTEIAPGIHRIESILGPRPFSQYLLRGERTLLVDTGVKETPGEVLLPFLDRAGIDPAELDLVLISHADVDHFGGNEAMRAVSPRAVFCAHVTPDTHSRPAPSARARDRRRVIVGSIRLVVAV